MIVIGLTGGIGTGKSEVARLLQELGAVVINADQVGHEAYTPHSETWQEVVKAFGERILLETGEIDRRKLGGIVFADPQQLARLNGIMHPRMAGLVSEKLQGLRATGTPVAVVEAAVLFEAGWDYLVEEVWTTDSPVDTVVGRLQARSGLGADEARKRIAAQMSSEERAARAAVVITNAGDLANLESTVRELWERRVEGRIERT
jgi:dephospho-CoA kinase